MYEDCCRCCTDICMSTYDDRGVLLLCHSYQLILLRMSTCLMFLSFFWSLPGTRYLWFFAFCFFWSVPGTRYLLFFAFCFFFFQPEGTY